MSWACKQLNTADTLSHAVILQTHCPMPLYCRHIVPCRYTADTLSHAVILQTHCPMPLYCMQTHCPTPEYCRSVIPCRLAQLANYLAYMHWIIAAYKLGWMYNYIIVSLSCLLFAELLHNCYIYSCSYPC